MLQVEARDRLVEHQDLALGDRAAGGELGQHPRELRALLLASRQALEGPLREMGDIGPQQRLRDDRQPPAAVEAAPDAVDADPHDLARGEGEGEARGLRQHAAQAGEPPGRDGARIRAFIGHAPGIGRILTGEQLDEGGFAGPVRADNDGHPSRREIERDAFDEGRAADPVADALRLQDGGAHASSTVLRRRSSQRK